MSAQTRDHLPDGAGGVSVIATVYDEIGSIAPLVTALLGGQRVPDEIVISDAGSGDGTREALDDLARHEPRLVVLDVPGNRSVGRNAAIAAARFDRIASIDGGCIPEEGWLRALVEPFDRGARWIGGFYRPIGSTRAICIGLTMVYVLEETRGGFLPSARSMAFERSAWEEGGRFPEHLEVSEDTAFDEAMAAAGIEMTFVPEAIVGWSPPSGFLAQAKVVFTWSRSDGRAGIGSFGYRWEGLRVAAALVLGLGGWIVTPWAALAGLVPLVALAFRQTRHKYRWAPRGVARFAWIPLAWFVGLVARLSGFGLGWAQRRLLRRRS